MGRAQSAIATTPQQQLRPSGGYASEEPGTVATAVRRIVATSAGGDRPCRQSRPERRRLSLLLHINSLLQTVFVHAALGGDGPRWQPLNGADCHALWARRQLESVLAGGNDDSGIKCDRTATALVHRLGSAWRRQRRSGPVSSATESKFVYFSCEIGLFFILALLRIGIINRLSIRPLLILFELILDNS